MKKEFLSYELEVELVKLGFNEKTFDVHSDIITQGFKVVKKPTPRILFQQAFRFFRAKYNLDSFCKQIELKGKSYWKISKIETTEKIKGYSNFTDSYEQAELECLKKLIEITKEQNVK